MKIPKKRNKKEKKNSIIWIIDKINLNLEVFILGMKLLKKMQKIFLASIVAFSTLGGGIALAANEETDVQNVIPVNKVSVHDVVPQAYLGEYAGKYQTIEEVKKAAGFEWDTNKNSDNSSQSFVEVGSVDEYAALLFFYKDITDEAKIVETTPQMLSNNGLLALQSNSYYVDSEFTYNDFYVFWMKAYVRSYFVNDKISGTPTTDSGIFGVHPGISYKHNKERSYVTVNSSKTGGFAHIEGDATVSIFYEGFGDVGTKRIVAEFNFGK